MFVPINHGHKDSTVCPKSSMHIPVVHSPASSRQCCCCCCCLCYDTRLCPIFYPTIFYSFIMLGFLIQRTVPEDWLLLLVGWWGVEM